MIPFPMTQEQAHKVCGETGGRLIDHCCFCHTPLEHVFLDLGRSPLANAYRHPGTSSNPVAEESEEATYPLFVYVCSSCFLVQLGYQVDPSVLFSNYAYLSSYSSTWIAHTQTYVETMVKRFSMTPDWTVCEVGSNDGCLLKQFVDRGMSVWGVEPAQNICAMARENKVPTWDVFFGIASAQAMQKAGLRADLLIANNVLAHVPDIQGFLAAAKIILSETGVMTVEVPHLQTLMQNTEFDTVYHEHCFYFSFSTLNALFAHHGLTIFEVEKLPTHGGSLRIFATHNTHASTPVTAAVRLLLQQEDAFGLKNIETYLSFQQKVDAVKRQFLEFLIFEKSAGKRIIGYGAPAKAATLLNFCGVDRSLIELTVDKNPLKQGYYLPGVSIPIFHPDKLFEVKPDYVVVFPWNIVNEVASEIQAIEGWGGRCVVPIPGVRILP